MISCRRVYYSPITLQNMHHFYPTHCNSIFTFQLFLIHSVRLCNSFMNHRANNNSSLSLSRLSRQPLLYYVAQNDWFCFSNVYTYLPSNRKQQQQQQQQQLCIQMLDTKLALTHIPTMHACMRVCACLVNTA